MISATVNLKKLWPEKEIPNHISKQSRMECTANIPVPDSTTNVFKRKGQDQNSTQKGL
jgi:hypothetical protein